MKEIFSYIVIIAVIALIGFICYMIWKKNGTDMTTDARQGNPEHRKNGLNAQNEEDSDEPTLPLYWRNGRSCSSIRKPGKPSRR